MVIPRCEQIDAHDTWRVTIVCVCASQKAAASSFADEGIRMDITHDEHNAPLWVILN